MRNYVLDYFQSIATAATREQWDAFVFEVNKKKCCLTIQQLSNFMGLLSQPALTPKLKEYIFESFKVKKGMEDNPEEINERVVNARDIISTRLMKKNKKIDDLIAIQRE